MRDNFISEAASPPWYWHGINLFDGAAPAAREAFFQQSQPLDFRAHARLFSADDPADRVFWLECGMVKIYHLSAAGDVTIFWICTPGDLFGAGGICGSAQQSVHAQALGAGRLRTLRRGDFERLILEHPQIGLNVIKLVGARLRLACDAVADKAALRAEARLAGVLLRLAQQCGQLTEGGVRIAIALSHQDISGMVGTTRQTVSQTLKQFERKGLLGIEQRRLCILQPAALAQIAGADTLPLSSAV